MTLMICILASLIPSAAVDKEVEVAEEVSLLAEWTIHLAIPSAEEVEAEVPSEVASVEAEEDFSLEFDWIFSFFNYQLILLLSYNGEKIFKGKSQIITGTLKILFVQKEAGAFNFKLQDHFATLDILGLANPISALWHHIWRRASLFPGSSKKHSSV